MLKKYLEIGQIVGTHGVRGEIRVNPWCDSPQFFKNFKFLYSSADGCGKMKILNCRPHGNIVLLTLEGVDRVEQAQALRNKLLYMDRTEAKLPDGTYFIQDLIGCEVFDADSGVKYGTLSGVSETGANDVWFIKTDEGKEYLIPAIPDVVIESDVEAGIIKIRPLEGIFE